MLLSLRYRFAVSLFGLLFALNSSRHYLELAEGNPEDFKLCLERPELLRFSWGESLRVFTVAELSAPVRPTVELLAGKKRIVWVSEKGAVPEGLTLPPKHFFAARLEDGSHRFYGSNGP